MPLMASGLRLARGKKGSALYGRNAAGRAAGYGRRGCPPRVQPETLKRGFRVWRPQKKRCIRGYFGPGAVGWPVTPVHKTPVVSSVADAMQTAGGR